MFGPPLLQGTGDPLPFLREQRFRLLLVLAVHARPVDHEELVQLFWPEAAPAQARINLRKTWLIQFTGATLEASII